MIDDEPSVIDKVKNGSHRNLYHPDDLIIGKSGSNVFHTSSSYCTRDEK